MWLFVIYRLEPAVVMAVAGFGKRPEPLQTSCGLESELACRYICRLLSGKAILVTTGGNPKKYLGEKYTLRNSINWDQQWTPLATVNKAKLF